MKTFKQLVLLAGACGLLSSCGNSTGGQSTPTDATVRDGTAPVQYSEGTPGTTVDTTNNRRTEQLQTARKTARTDTMNEPPHASAGSGASNTTDKRTTAGSANDGQAGKK